MAEPLPADWNFIAKRIFEEFTTYPNEYLRQFAISKTLNPDMRALSRAYWLELVQSDHFMRMLPDILDSKAGNPFECDFLPRISPQTVQHAYYVELLRKHGVSFKDASIVEIGGGYGGLARIYRKLGGQGRYQIADLPQMHKLQQHYLTQSLGDHGVEFITLDEMGGADLLVATFSVSEMPLELRRSLEAKYYRFNNLFFAHNQSFGGVDSLEYFKSLAQRIGAEHFKDKHRNAWFVFK